MTIALHDMPLNADRAERPDPRSHDKENSMPASTSSFRAERTPFIPMNTPESSPEYADSPDGLSDPAADQGAGRPVAPRADGRRTLATSGCGRWRSCFDTD